MRFATLRIDGTLTAARIEGTAPSSSTPSTPSRPTCGAGG